MLKMMFGRGESINNNGYYNCGYYILYKCSLEFFRFVYKEKKDSDEFFRFAVGVLFVGKLINDEIL